MRKCIPQIVVIVSFAMLMPMYCLGQSNTSDDQEKLAADQKACQEHAKAYSGFDPSAAQAPEQNGRPQRGAGLRGAARGAAKGAIAGEVVEHVGDEGEHDDAAEVGAALGAVRGGAKSRRAAKEQAQAPATQESQSESSAYAESYNDCMKSRGYEIQ